MQRLSVAGVAGLLLGTQTTQVSLTASFGADVLDIAAARAKQLAHYTEVGGGIVEAGYEHLFFFEPTNNA